MGQIAQTDGVEPEHVVECVVQTGRDEQAVKEGVDASADTTHGGDTLTKSNKSTEDERPSKEQHDGDNDADDGGHDGDATLAGEEGQPVGKTGVLELVVASATDDGGQDADEGVTSDLGERDTLGRGKPSGLSIGVHTTNGANNSGVQELLDHQEGDEASEASGAIVIVGKADSGADCEQPGHVIDKSAACLDEQEAGGIGKTGSVTGSTHDCGSEQVAHTHKNTCDGKRRDGKHQRFAELLEVLHHMVSPPTFLSLLPTSPMSAPCAYRLLRLPALVRKLRQPSPFSRVAGMYGSTHSIQTSTTFRSNYYIVAKRLFLARKR